MGISRMLKMQLLGHSAIRDEVKRYLRESGVLEITEVSFDAGAPGAAPDNSGEFESRLEMAVSALAFLEPFAPKLSFFQKMSVSPLVVTPERIGDIEMETPLSAISGKCADLAGTMRALGESLENSRDLASSLEPWKDLDLPLENLSTEGYTAQLWTVQDKVADKHLEELAAKFEYGHFEEFRRDAGKSYIASIIPMEDQPALLEAMKETGALHHAFDHLRGTPAEVFESETAKWPGIEKAMEEARGEALSLVPAIDNLRILADHYRELIGLAGIEGKIAGTDSTFVIEGWIRAIDRKRIEKEIRGRFDEIEMSFRDPIEGEEPPISLENGRLVQPYEFVTTLYGRPAYGGLDPTPLLAPFFILFFALCLTDAGYGLTLALLTGFILIKYKPSGGTGLLMKLLFMGGLVTMAAGVVTGGILGIDIEALPGWMQQFVFVNPLVEPMKMLNISFLMGIVHILFGMGVRMTAHFRAGMHSEAVLDDLAWILFLIVLAPLGYSGILGGSVPPAVIGFCKWAVMAIAAVIFLTGGRRQKSPVKKILAGLVKFYDVVGYFGDVLSYARLLALGLATSAIAIAVNDIAKMVIGMPFYTGYVLMVVILIGGHTFNLAVNTLGAFVHSGRLQYLEFFSKFFTGGGRPFRPFRSERQYSVMRKTDNGS